MTDDAMVLRVAKVLQRIFDRKTGDGISWEDEDQSLQQEFLGEAREVLNAINQDHESRTKHYRTVSSSCDRRDGKGGSS